MLTLSVLSSCRTNETQPSVPAAIKVQTITLGERSNVESIEYVGMLEATDRLPLSLLAGGRVVEVACANGDKVKKGDLLVRIDDSQARNAYRSAKATLDQARDGYNRVEKVYRQGGVAEVKWVEIKTRLSQAEAMASAALRELGNYSLYAPRGGTISNFGLKQGQVVAPGAIIMDIYSSGDVEAVFSVPEQDISLIEDGQEVQISIPAIGEDISAKVSYKAYSGDALSHAYEVKANMDNVSDELKHKLLPGMVAKVKCELHHGQDPHRHVVPAVAVSIDKSGPYVWIVRNGKAYRTFIKVEDYVDNGVAVSDGIKDGDLIVTGGYQKLYEGACVE